MKKTSIKLLVVAAILVSFAIGFAGCASPENIVPKMGIRVKQGQTITAPVDGWFLSDSEIKDLFMDEYDKIMKGEEK